MDDINTNVLGWAPVACTSQLRNLLDTATTLACEPRFQWGHRTLHLYRVLVHLVRIRHCTQILLYYSARPTRLGMQVFLTLSTEILRILIFMAASL